MELDYAPLGNLQEWVAAQGGLLRIPLAARLELLARICDAVEAAHSIDVLHKDLKPSNILMYDDRGAIKPRLCDFGIGVLADLTRLENADITRMGFTQTLLAANESSRTGTRLYTPPECLMGLPFTKQGDVYALGVMFYQLLIGHFDKPIAYGWERDVSEGEFDAAHDHATPALEQSTLGPSSSPSKTQGKRPTPIARAVYKETIGLAIEGDPSRRVPSAAELARLIRELPTTIETREREETSRVTELAKQETARKTRVLKWIIAIAACVLAVVGTLGGMSYVQWQRAEEASMEATEGQKQISEKKNQIAIALEKEKQTNYDLNVKNSENYFIRGIVEFGNNKFFNGLGYLINAYRECPADNDLRKAYEHHIYQRTKHIKSVFMPSPKVSVATLNPKTSVVVTGWSGKLDSWDSYSGKHLNNAYSTHDRGGIVRMGHSPDGTYYYAEYATFNMDDDYQENNNNFVIKKTDDETYNEIIERRWIGSFEKDEWHGCVICRRFCDNEKYLLIAYRDGFIRIIDLVKRKSRLVQVDADIKDVRWNRISNGYAIGYGSGKIELRNAEDDRITKKINRYNEGCRALTFSPDGYELAIVFESTTVVIDTTTFQTLAKAEVTANEIEYNPLGSIIYLKQYRSLVSLTNRLKTLGQTENYFTSEIKCFSMSPDGARLAIANEKSIMINDRCCRHVHEIVLHAKVLVMSYVSDGLAIGVLCDDGSYLIVDTCGSTNAHVDLARKTQTKYIRHLPNSDVFIHGGDREVIKTVAKEDAPFANHNRYEFPSLDYHCLRGQEEAGALNKSNVFSSDCLYGRHNGKLTISSINAIHYQHEIGVLPSEELMQVSRGGRYAAIYNRFRKILRVADMHEQPGHLIEISCEDSPYLCSLTSEGHLWLRYYGGKSECWDMHDQKKLYENVEKQDRNYHAFSREGRYAAFSSHVEGDITRHAVHIEEMLTGKLLCTAELERGVEIKYVQFSDNDRYLIISAKNIDSWNQSSKDTIICIYDTKAKRLTGDPIRMQLQKPSLGWSKDSNMVALISEYPNKYYIIDTLTSSIILEEYYAKTFESSSNISIGFSADQHSTFIMDYNNVIRNEFMFPQQPTDFLGHCILRFKNILPAKTLGTSAFPKNGERYGETLAADKKYQVESAAWIKEIKLRHCEICLNELSSINDYLGCVRILRTMTKISPNDAALEDRLTELELDYSKYKERIASQYADYYSSYSKNRLLSTVQEWLVKSRNISKLP
ncbi:MAG: protein kinase family protein [Pirellulales bacterium]